MNPKMTDLFTPNEHVVLATWFDTQPLPVDCNKIDINQALKRLSFDEEPRHLYTREDAAVALILLENMQNRLPQWATWNEEQGWLVGRPTRESAKVVDRKVMLMPQLLFTINWADSFPGYSWPMAYHLIWVPLYDRYVVTASADTDELLGYADFALGSFSTDESVTEAAGRIIRNDWEQQYAEWDQPRWAYLFDTGLISATEAEAWADKVWEGENNDDEDEDE